MAYITLDDLRGLVPDEWLTQSLDDDSDGVIDAWDQVLRAAEDAVDGPLSIRYTTPFVSPPRLVVHATRIFAAEQCYQRRGVPEKENPFTAQAKALRELLLKIANGELALGGDMEREKPSASIITEPARTFSRGGNLSI